MEPVLCTITDVEDLVKDIIKKNNLEAPVDIKYSTGSEIEHGFSSRTVGVDITDKNRSKTLHLWVKFIADYMYISKLSMDKLYLNEIYFYETIYPAYRKLLEEHAVEDGFRNVAQCYGTLSKGMLALEDLKHKGYRPFDKNEEATDGHILLVFEAYAKFHALSFAFKDQKGDDCVLFRRNLFNFYELGAKKAGIDRNIKYAIEEFLKQLDPAEDEKILRRCKVEELISHIVDPSKFCTERAILTQGDCWYNNSMFLYDDDDKDKNKKNPIDVVLIDWQMIRFVSPVYDLSYYFYPIASQQSLDKLAIYMKMYHEELSRQIRKLGSDPEALYPYDVFEKEWKDHSKFGFAISFMITKTKLSGIRSTWERQNEFSKRMKALAKHFIDNNFL